MPLLGTFSLVPYQLLVNFFFFFAFFSCRDFEIVNMGYDFDSYM